MATTVAEVMTESLVSATPEMTLKQLDALFVRNAISGMPVLERGSLVGVVSQSDVVRAVYDEQVEAQRVSDFHMSPYPIPIPALETLARDSRRIADHLLGLTVAEVMSAVPVTVEASDTIEHAATMLVEERIHRVLVTDNGELVGIVSALDLIAAFVHEHS